MINRGCPKNNSPISIYDFRLYATVPSIILKLIIPVRETRTGGFLFYLRTQNKAEGFPLMAGESDKKHSVRFCNFSFYGHYRMYGFPSKPLLLSLDFCGMDPVFIMGGECHSPYTQSLLTPCLRIISRVNSRQGRNNEHFGQPGEHK